MLAICETCNCMIEEPFFQNTSSPLIEHQCQKCATKGGSAVNYTMLITMDWSDFWFNKKQWHENYAMELVGRFLFCLAE